MADLAYHGGVSPAEYEQMLYSDSKELGRLLRERDEADKEFLTDLVKLIAESNGVRVVRG